MLITCGIMSASLIYQDEGLLQFCTLKASETFTGKFLAYHVGRSKKTPFNALV